MSEGDSQAVPGVSPNVIYRLTIERSWTTINKLLRMF